MPIPFGRFRLEEEEWLASGRTPVSPDRESFVLNDPKLNVDFRFGAEQADNLRAYEDILYSMRNLACRVVASIRLAAWAHLAEIRRTIITHPMDWRLFKAEPESS